MQKLSFADYTKEKALSYSGIKEILKSGAHHEAWWKRPQTEPTAAMILGDATHTTLLEPHLFDKRFWVYNAPENSKIKITKDGLPYAVEKEEWARIEKESEGKLILPKNQYQDIKWMIEKLYSKKTVRNLLDGGQAEMSLINKIDGVPVKARVDYIHPEKMFILDLKTSNEPVGETRFPYKINSMGYHLQAAWYLKVANLFSNFNAFKICAIETFYPYECQVYNLDFGALELGNMLVNKALTRYKKCLDENKWPGYDDEEKDISVPGYAFSNKQLEGPIDDE